MLLLPLAGFRDAASFLTGCNAVRTGDTPSARYGHGVGGREQGLIDADKCTHVVVASIDGPQAACNRAPIISRLPGIFDPSDPLACQDCVEAVTPAS
jgi:hypothetical protein